jgi:hypothetical protein
LLRPAERPGLHAAAGQEKVSAPRKGVGFRTPFSPLEEAILNYAGCMVVISHDHWFLDRIAEGSFQTYEEQRKSRLGIAADQPHRFR